MNLDKVYNLLNIEQLDESTQKQVQEHLEEVVNLKAKEKAQELSEKAVEEVKEELTEEYEQKFEEYKEDIVSKFSDFVDKVIDEEFQIPEKIQEYARKGELYEDLIEQFKIRLGIDEGALDEEARELLKESKKKIEEEKKSKNDLYSENLKLKQDAKEFAAELYKKQKCDGLTESQKDTMLKMLDGINDKQKIDEKYDFILENVLNESKSSDDDNTLNEDKNSDDDSEKGTQNVDESFNSNDDNEPSNDPFQKHINSWLNVAKSS